MLDLQSEGIEQYIEETVNEGLFVLRTEPEKYISWVKEWCFNVHVSAGSIISNLINAELTKGQTK